MTNSTRALISWLTAPSSLGINVTGREMICGAGNKTENSVGITLIGTESVVTLTRFKGKVTRWEATEYII